jgi:hypothetical protein
VESGNEKQEQSSDLRSSQDTRRTRVDAKEQRSDLRSSQDTGKDWDVVKEKLRICLLIKLNDVLLCFSLFRRFLNEDYAGVLVPIATEELVENRII